MIDKNLEDRASDQNFIHIPMNDYQEAIARLTRETKTKYGRSLIIDNARSLDISRYHQMMISTRYKEKLLIDSEITTIESHIHWEHSESELMHLMLENPILNKKFIEDRQKIVFDYINNDKVYLEALKLKQAISEEIEAASDVNDEKGLKNQKIIYYADSIIKLHNAISSYSMPEHIPELISLKASIEKLPNFSHLKDFFSQAKKYEAIIDFRTEEEYRDSSTYSSLIDNFTGEWHNSTKLRPYQLIHEMKTINDIIMKSPVFEKPAFVLPMDEALEKLSQDKDTESKWDSIYILSRFWIHELGNMLTNSVPHTEHDDKKRFGIYNMNFVGAQLSIPLMLARKARRWKKIGFPICKPDINSENRFVIEEGYCPVIANYTRIKEEKNEKMMPEETIPIVRNFHIDKDHSTMIITGPNMAGKSTILREFAQHIYSALLGGAVLAKKADISLVNQIFSIFPGKDNPYNNMGGYLTDIKPLSDKMKDIHAPLSKYSVALLDEFAKTTDDNEHVDANTELVTMLQKMGVTTLMTTHDKDIIQYANELPKTQFRQVCASYDPEANKLTFTREFKDGIGQSFGEILAKQYGIETKILDAEYKQFLENNKDSNDNNDSGSEHAFEEDLDKIIPKHDTQKKNKGSDGIQYTIQF